ncbi:MAG: SRPBCC family protein [Methylobacteriaceae bacterium]|nr:SRPBCC family protein [Methylobacteriaceae bacterium]MBV9393006.1 SRPBCC family protein [Methylobacteriaceae bacterium]
MLTAIGIILLLILLAIVAAFAYASTKPDDFRLERTTSIDAPPDTIFPLLDDFRRWAEWSPWEDKDPAMKRTYVGAPAGQGAAYAWRGNRNVGAGRMEIVETSPPLRLLIDLHFLKPFQARHQTEFHLEPAAAGTGVATRVTWRMHGRAHPMMKTMALFMDMDRMVGRDFETGLANLKRISENPGLPP